MKTKLTGILAVATVALFVWAPWLNTEKVHDKVLLERGRVDHTVDNAGALVCDYEVVWVPFGRWVASCEGGWYVTFWFQILPPLGRPLVPDSKE
jgi:hypothetical protein